MSKMGLFSFVIRSSAVGVALGFLLGSCGKTSDGDGSESHFVACRVDSECANLGANYRCIEQKCVVSHVVDAQVDEPMVVDAPMVFDAQVDEPMVSPPTHVDGGIDAHVGASCPPSPYYSADGGFEPMVSPPGYVDGGIYGCYAPRQSAPAGWAPTTQTNACPGTSTSCTYAPTGLPCGQCPSEGEVCSMSVVAVCDCGAGPIVDVYSDEWACKCTSGQWECGIVAPSGASCQICSFACLDETRSTPYSTGMVVTSPSGVTVALTSMPEPPAVGDNTWTLTIEDANGTPVTDAAITVSPFMPDHAHGSARLAVVTEIGGGDYVADPVNFNMPGYWETLIEIKKAPIDESVVIKLCVQ